MTARITLDQTVEQHDEPVGGTAPWWVESIPEPRRRRLRIWLWAGAALTACTLVVGGITRLTESGLSIVDWAPIVGAIPPISDQDWQEAFARYQQYPEYRLLRPDMTLSEFKYIYFWEYLHRMIGRVIGLVFIIPFLFFWLKGYFTGPLLRRVLLLFGLGGLQGAMGWYMVSSGLVDRTDVSHYRLAMHLMLAIAIFVSCVWFANDLLVRPTLSSTAAARRSVVRWLAAFGALLFVQIFWGALVAGLNAGFVFNTFPLMNGRLLPPNGWSTDPAWLNFFENLATVQWMHRVLGTLLLLTALGLLVRVRRDPSLAAFRTGATLIAALVGVQYGLGIATLLTHVEIPISVAHQFTALIIVGVWTVAVHRVTSEFRSSAEPSATQAAQPAPA